MVKRVCLVSGGTGGHLWPALVLSQALQEAGHETLLLTEGRVVERNLLERVGCDAEALDIRGRGVGRALRLCQGTLKARRLLRDQGVDLVISTGGRTSVAVGLAARSLGLPLFLLEQNAVAGRANRLLSHLAQRVYLGLPPVRALRRSITTGTPLRREFRVPDRTRARVSLGLSVAEPVVLVTGGSQGAGVLNELVPLVLCRLGRPLQVMHLSGPDRDEEVRMRYAAEGNDGRVNAVVRAMAVDMARLYAAADLVICRGGGCTVAELIAVGRAAVVVPYPFHRDRQQIHNARVLERAGAAVIVEQRELTERLLRTVVRSLCDDPERLRRMGEAAVCLQPADPCTAILMDLERTVSLQ